MARSDALQQFVNATLIAFNRFAADPRSRSSMERLSLLLEIVAPERQDAGSRLPVCTLLDEALDLKTGQTELANLIESFRVIEPRLRWDTKSRPDKSASPNFAEGHANGMILGPGGIEERKDLWLGVTLMAPNVRYPDHHHSPEETYLVISQGEFK
jgi:hypothetical protein